MIVYHKEWAYLLARFDIRQVDTVEDRPGIPPSPGHLVQLVRRMRDENIRVIIVSAWNDRRTAERVAADAGAKVVLLAHGAGALKGTDGQLLRSLRLQRAPARGGADTTLIITLRDLDA